MDAVRECFSRATRASSPEGGYFLWLQLPRSVDALALHRLALACNITLAPGQIFSTDRCFTHCVRINFGDGADPRFASALRTVGELVTQLSTN
ncbi:hypothetical protein [Variovorax sp. PBL-H6]|uniref:hypothetical protein n=1 Tax=Variovorax sp. PBL-H6 TaxID=434009 RepID=UPI0013A5A8AF|nr:hypothetical protein [Variovorax sp. PBL-H6]